MKLYAFFSADLSTLGSNAIILGTGGLVDWWRVRTGRLAGFSHCGPVFWGWGAPPSLPSAEPLELRRAGGAFYYESIWSVDSQTHKTGVRGPKPLADLLAWRDEDPEHHKVELVEIPGVTEMEMSLAHSRCEWAKQNIKYAKGQIFQNALGFLFKRGIRLDQRTPLAWTCCELFLRVMPARLLVDAFRLGDYLFDEYCPWGDRGPGVYQMLRKHVEAMKARETTDGTDGTDAAKRGRMKSRQNGD